MRILRILSGALLAVAVALTVTATPAAAHVTLVKSTPEDGAELQAPPEEVKLTFSEVLDAPSTQVAVADSRGDTVDQAKPRIEDKVITQPLTLPEKGDYTVAYRIVSEDGHPVEDSISFSVSSVPGGDTAPKEDESEAKQTEADGDETDGAEAADQGIGWGPVAAVAGGLAVLVAAIVLFVRNRSRVS